MSDKMHTFVVMHDKGEMIDGHNIRPYETFKARMTDEYKQKVEKGFLQLSTESPVSKSTKAKSKKK